MTEKLAAAVEHVAATATVSLVGVVWLEWLNENHRAIVSMCAFLTLIVTVVAAKYRAGLRKREVIAIEKMADNYGRRSADREA